MSEEICIPASVLVRLIRRLRAEGAIRRHDAFAVYQGGIGHGKQHAANEIAKLLAEYGFEIESEEESA